MSAFLYRGVHARHPAIEAARNGTCRPGDATGLVSAQLHNAGSLSHLSPYTSWTRSLSIAGSFAARQGSGGVILRAEEGSPPSGAPWRWEYSDDVWGESELLLWGVREGLTVLEP